MNSKEFIQKSQLRKLAAKIASVHDNSDSDECIDNIADVLSEFIQSDPEREALSRELNSKEMELAACEHQRLKDNQYLLSQRDKYMTLCSKQREIMEELVCGSESAAILMAQDLLCHRDPSICDQISERDKKIEELKTLCTKMKNAGDEIAHYFDPGPIPAAEPTDSDLAFGNWQYVSGLVQTALSGHDKDPKVENPLKLTESFHVWLKSLGLECVRICEKSTLLETISEQKKVIERLEKEAATADEADRKVEEQSKQIMRFKLHEQLAQYSIEEIHEIIEERDAMKETQRWRSIETAPMDGTVFLAWRPSLLAEVKVQIMHWAFGGWYVYGVEHADDRFYPTHWLPLPVEPKKEVNK